MDFKSCPICDAKTDKQAEKCQCGYDYCPIEIEEKPKTKGKKK